MTDDNSANLSDDALISLTPRGYRYDLVVVAMTKRWLQLSTTLADRMEALEGLAKIPHELLTPEVVAAVQPMSETEFKMTMEAMKLPEREWIMLGRADVFAAFAKLNPSFLNAARLLLARTSYPAQAAAV